ncbi:OLC1v1020491C1 [Oldenlandia corymbosa var. corymbosa]|uniref:OLC1v1020491C1 n=1 Tax=Oldenlandia corymbosa var. corymbosa TaxID=529605 RepID=A0AAV1EGP6_OLDCO|nr:OLC1v1020491C1 [Oldenlandia corymbosa var. corymbosa]
MPPRQKSCCHEEFIQFVQRIKPEKQSVRQRLYKFGLQNSRPLPHRKKSSLKREALYCRKQYNVDKQPPRCHQLPRFRDRPMRQEYTSCETQHHRRSRANQNSQQRKPMCKTASQQLPHHSYSIRDKKQKQLLQRLVQVQDEIVLHFRQQLRDEMKAFRMKSERLLDERVLTWNDQGLEFDFGHHLFALESDYDPWERTIDWDSLHVFDNYADDEVNNYTDDEVNTCDIIHIPHPLAANEDIVVALVSFDVVLGTAVAEELCLPPLVISSPYGVNERFVVPSHYYSSVSPVHIFRVVPRCRRLCFSLTPFGDPATSQYGLRLEAFGCITSALLPCAWLNGGTIPLCKAALE